MPFQKGHKLAPGGARAGSGRHPDWLKEKCRRLVDEKKIVERLCSIAAGEDMDIFTTITGVKVPVPAPISAQVKAAQELLDRGFGKALQDVRQVDDEGKAIPYSIVIKQVNGSETI